MAFDADPPPGGYAWWYLDAISDDGGQALTLIAFVGSVFSPYYALARRRHGGTADPLSHCAVNLAIYDRGRGGRWAMTERGRGAVQRSRTSLAIGPSRLVWRDGVLTVRVDEIGLPFFKRLRGEIRVTPRALASRLFTLDAHGRHRWGPIAPSATVELDLEEPGRRWSGHGYLDHNHGDRPLERDFERWDWSRATLADGSTAVLYEVQPVAGAPRTLAWRFDAQGRAQAFEAPPAAALPRTGWQLARGTRSDAGQAGRVVRTLEDTPFYARSIIESSLLGERVTGVHESLSLRRFDSRIVQAMLPFRMPRRA